MECYNQHRCVEKREGPVKEMFFCCCEGDMCNREFTWEPTPAPPPTQQGMVLFQFYNDSALLDIGLIIHCFTSFDNFSAIVHFL